jgi:hypothetical protein
VSNHEHRDGTFDGKTYLYIRTNPADTGVEPLAPGLDFWVSPDIIVIKPGGAMGDEAVADQENQLQVIVTNAGGLGATDAYVEAFYANPSTVMTPATATPVGAGFVSIPGYNTATISFPWTPPSSEAGHRCLFARVSLAIPFDSYANPTVFDVVGDRHVAQRNVHVLSMGKAKRISFAFVVLNASQKREQVLIRAEEVRAPAALQQLRGAMHCEAAAFAAHGLGTIGLTWGRERVLHGDERHIALHASLLPARAAGGVVAAKGRASTADNAALTLEPGEARQAVLHVSRGPDAAEGDLNAVRITQTDANGVVRGGLTVVVRT